MSNPLPAAKKVEVRKVLYFDDMGRFASDPRKAKSVKLGKPIKRTIDLDGDSGSAVAIITVENGRKKVEIRDPVLEAEKKQARAEGNKRQYEAIGRYERSLKAMALEEDARISKAEEERLQRQRENLLLEDSMNRTLASKGGKTTAARNAKVLEYRAKLKDEGQKRLLEIYQKPADREQKRAAELELRARGVVVKGKRK